MADRGVKFWAFTSKQVCQKKNCVFYSKLHQKNQYRFVFPVSQVKYGENELDLTKIGKVDFSKMTIGFKIKSLREEAGMLERELAYKLNVGNAFICKVERDQKKLKKEHLKTLSELFNVAYSELETLWIASKVLYIVKGEARAIDILRTAEKELKHGNNV